MRELQLITIAAVISIFIGGGAFYLSEQRAAVAGDEQGVRTLAQGTFGPTQEGNMLTGRGNYILTNTNEFQAFWDILHAGTDPVPSLPRVVFAREDVIAVLHGIAPTGGYDIEVTDVVDTPRQRGVFVELTVPGPLCGTFDAVTNPFHLVAVPKSDLPLDAIESFAKTQCGA